MLNHSGGSIESVREEVSMGGGMSTFLPSSQEHRIVSSSVGRHSNSSEKDLPDLENFIPMCFHNQTDAHGTCKV